VHLANGEDMPLITEGDIRHASYYAVKLREFGQAYMTAEGRDTALRDFEGRPAP
jgi:hypothetical protein